MPEENIIKEMPGNPYLVAFFQANGLGIGDKWVAADYMIWIDNKHEEFRKIHNLPPHIELNQAEQKEFIAFINQDFYGGQAYEINHFNHCRHHSYEKTWAFRNGTCFPCNLGNDFLLIMIGEKR